MGPESASVLFQVQLACIQGEHQTVLIKVNTLVSVNQQAQIKGSQMQAGLAQGPKVQPASLRAGSLAPSNLKSRIKLGNRALGLYPKSGSRKKVATGSF